MLFCLILVKFLVDKNACCVFFRDMSLKETLQVALGKFLKKCDQRQKIFRFLTMHLFSSHILLAHLLSPAQLVKPQIAQKVIKRKQSYYNRLSYQTKF